MRAAGKAGGEFTIRPARAHDVPALAALAQEFQAYLNGLDDPGEAPEPAALSADVLRHDAFGEDPWFNIILAERAGAPVGYLLYHFGYWVDCAARALIVGDLFVQEAARGRGIGRALMGEAARILRRRGGTLVLWTVWDRNAAAIAFYRSLGAKTEREELLMFWPQDA